MTEPTFHYRPDVEVQLDNLVRLMQLQFTQGAVDAARGDLRAALSAAWSHGAVHGLMHRPEGEPALQNPYGETDNA